MKRRLRYLPHLLCLALCLCPARAVADTKADWETLRARDKGLNERSQAARSILQHAHTDNDCGKVVAEIIELCLKATTPQQLRNRVAEEIQKCEGDDTTKVLVHLLGQGQPYERDFLLHAARGLHAPDIDKAILAKGLTDEDAGNRRQALDILVLHKYAPAVPALEALLKAGKEPDLVHPIVAGVTTILKDTPGWDAWETRLIELARGHDDEVRRSALVALAETKNVALVDVFLEALPHPDWSTRLLALEFLERSAQKRAVTAIIEQMKHEPPGTRMNSECCRALERISGGMNFGDKADDWATWWKNNEATFEFQKNAAPSTPDRRPPSPKSDTAVAPRFYGIEIQSQRVCFVIDISGSMLEAVKAPEENGAGRIDVAKRELDRIIGQLPSGSLFNIISFNAQVDPWLDHVGDLPAGVDSRGKVGRKGPSTGDAREKEKEKEPEKTEAQKQKEAEERKKQDEALRAKARTWVGKLKAAGGTNIYDALEMAFADPEVDTIFFLTDGQPSVGRKIDPEAIRKDVQTWNATRRVKLNTIAIGAEFPLVMELAQDNGGQYKYFP